MATHALSTCDKGWECPRQRRELHPLPLAGQGWGEGQQNRFKHAIAIDQRVVVPEPKHAPAFTGKKRISSGVARTVGMLSTIQFDDKPVLDRGKVRDVRSDWHLPTKFDAAKPAIPEQKPH